MRRPIGWNDRDADGQRREIEVSIHVNTITWKVKYGRRGEWEKNFEPSSDDWQLLLDKLLELKQRGHLFDQEIALVKSIIDAQ